MQRTRVIATVTSLCFLLNAVFSQALFAVMQEPAAQLPPPAAPSEFLIPSSAGTITDSAWFGSDTVVMLIQDLHCHGEVQRNIAQILTTVTRQCSVPRVYVEGGVGRIDTSWTGMFNNIDFRNRVLNVLLDNGELSGAEYFAITAEYPGILAGLERKDLYFQNLARLRQIIERRGEAHTFLPAVHKSVHRLKQQYYSRRNRTLDALAKKYRSGRLSDERYFRALARFAGRTGKSMSFYPALQAYLTALRARRTIHAPELSRDLRACFTVLKEQLPYAEYRVLIEKAAQPAELDALCVLLMHAGERCHVAMERRFPAIAAAAVRWEAAQRVNPAALIHENDRLFWELQLAVAENQAEKDAVFIAAYASCLEAFLKNKITASDYELFIDQHDRFAALWQQYVSADGFPNLAGYGQLLQEFYQANLQRNECFLQTMLADAAFVPGNDVGAVSVSREKLDALLHTRKVIPVVAGGFHTLGLTELLYNNRISYVVVTPSVREGAGSANAAYEQLALEPARSFPTQTFALQSYAQRLLGLLPPEQAAKVTRSWLEGELAKAFPAGASMADIENAIQGINAYFLQRNIDAHLAIDPTEKRAGVVCVTFTYIDHRLSVPKSQQSAVITFDVPQQRSKLRMLGAQTYRFLPVVGMLFLYGIVWLYHTHDAAHLGHTADILSQQSVYGMGFLGGLFKARKKKQAEQTTVIDESINPSEITQTETTTFDITKEPSESVKEALDALQRETGISASAKEAMKVLVDLVNLKVIKKGEIYNQIIEWIKNQTEQMTEADCAWIFDMLDQLHASPGQIATIADEMLADDSKNINNGKVVLYVINQLKKRNNCGVAISRFKTLLNKKNTAVRVAIIDLLLQYAREHTQEVVEILSTELAKEDTALVALNAINTLVAWNIIKPEDVTNDGEQNMLGVALIALLQKFSAQADVVAMVVGIMKKLFQGQDPSQPNFLDPMTQILLDITADQANLLKALAAKSDQSEAPSKEEVIDIFAHQPLSLIIFAFIFYSLYRPEMLKDILFYLQSSLLGSLMHMLNDGRSTVTLWQLMQYISNGALYDIPRILTEIPRQVVGTPISSLAVNIADPEAGVSVDDQWLPTPQTWFAAALRVTGNMEEQADALAQKGVHAFIIAPTDDQVNMKRSGYTQLTTTDKSAKHGNYTMPLVVLPDSKVCLRVWAKDVQRDNNGNGTAVILRYETSDGSALSADDQVMAQIAVAEWVQNHEYVQQQLLGQKNLVQSIDCLQFYNETLGESTIQYLKTSRHTQCAALVYGVHESAVNSKDSAPLFLDVGIDPEAVVHIQNTIKRYLDELPAETLRGINRDAVRWARPRNAHITLASFDARHVHAGEAAEQIMDNVRQMTRQGELFSTVDIELSDVKIMKSGAIYVEVKSSVLRDLVSDIKNTSGLPPVKYTRNNVILHVTLGTVRNDVLFNGEWQDDRLAAWNKAFKGFRLDTFKQRIQKIQVDQHAGGDSDQVWTHVLTSWELPVTGKKISRQQNGWAVSPTMNGFDADISNMNIEEQITYASVARQQKIVTLAAQRIPVLSETIAVGKASGEMSMQDLLDSSYLEEHARAGITTFILAGELDPELGKKLVKKVAALPVKVQLLFRCSLQVETDALRAADARKIQALMEAGMDGFCLVYPSLSAEQYDGMDAFLCGLFTIAYQYKENPLLVIPFHSPQEDAALARVREYTHIQRAGDKVNHAPYSLWTRFDIEGIRTEKNFDVIQKKLLAMASNRDVSVIMMDGKDVEFCQKIMANKKKDFTLFFLSVVSARVGYLMNDPERNYENMYHNVIKMKRANIPELTPEIYDYAYKMLMIYKKSGQRKQFAEYLKSMLECGSFPNNDVWKYLGDQYRHLSQESLSDETILCYMANTAGNIRGLLEQDIMRREEKEKGAFRFREHGRYHAAAVVDAELYIHIYHTVPAGTPDEQKYAVLKDIKTADPALIEQIEKAKELFMATENEREVLSQNKQAALPPDAEEKIQERITTLHLLSIPRSAAQRHILPYLIAMIADFAPREPEKSITRQTIEQSVESATELLLGVKEIKSAA